MDIKELQGQIQTAFEALKAAGETQATEIKKFGAVTEETKTMISKINGHMDELKGRLDALETKANRTPFGANGEPVNEQELKQAATFFKFMREGKAGLSADEKKSLVEDTTGQILVPQALDQMIYRGLQKLTVMRDLASVRTIGVDRIRRRSLNELTVGWGKLETTTAKLGDFESSLSPSEAWLYVEDAYGLTKIGEDELEDTDVNLQSYLADSFQGAFAALEDLAFMKGTGHANEQPEGVLNGATVTRFNSAAAGAATADDFIKLVYQVPAQYRKNGSFVVNSMIEQAVRLFKDNNGQYMWQPSLQAGKPASFLGYGIYNQDEMDNSIATGKEIAVFGDFKSGYQIIDRAQGAITRLNELYAEDGLVGFRYKRRVGGGVIRANALRVLKVQ